MKWITGITIDNYRAFAKPEAIFIPNGQHLLIYGENGSGKSSIYNALNDFFQSSNNPTYPFELNLFSNSAGNNTGTIKLKIAELDNNKRVVAEDEKTFGKPDDQSNHRTPVIQRADKVKGFIDYKRLLKTYLIDTPQGQNPDLYSLLVEGILADHLINRSPGGGVSNVELGKEWHRISDAILIHDRRLSRHKYALKELPFFGECKSNCVNGFNLG